MYGIALDIPYFLPCSLENDHLWLFFLIVYKYAELF